MKKSPFWRTGIALLVLAGLGSWALFYESKRPTKDERDKEKAKVAYAKFNELKANPVPSPFGVRRQ